MRRLSLILVACLVAALGVSEVFAGTVSPELDRLISAAQPGEEIPVIINLSDKAELASIADRDKGTKRRRIVESLRAKGELSQVPLRALLNRLGAKRVKPFWVINAVAAAVSADSVRALASLPGVETIGLDGTVAAPLGYSVINGTSEWNIDRINAPALWSAGYDGTGVVVANMDTGVDYLHPDLAQRFRGGANSWFDPFNQTSLPFDAAGSSTGHGTGTMSIMVGGSAGGSAIGVAPGATWIAAKIFDNSRSTRYQDVHLAFQWLLDPDGDPATDDAPDIVNASWGLSNPGLCNTEFSPDIAVLKTAGIPVVFAAGNSGPAPATSVSPANNPGGFAVGAADSSDSVIPESSRGPSACGGGLFPHVVAPGKNVLVATPGGGYIQRSGTSFAAPHVSGALALLLNAFPLLTVAELETAIKSSANVPDNFQGYGRIDLLRAYQVASSPQPNLSPVPASYNFGPVYTGQTSPAASFAIYNLGLADLTVSSVSVTGPQATEYAVITDGCTSTTLTSGAVCYIDAAFGPLFTGNRSAYLTLASNDPVKPVFDLPLSGSGIFDTIGVYRLLEGRGQWHLDNGDFLDDCGAIPHKDGCVGPFGGWSADIPVVGDWNGDGRTKIGIYRRVKSNSFWYLDVNGNGVFDGCGAGQDRCYGPFPALPGDVPVVGDWNGDGISKIGIYRFENRYVTEGGFWYMGEGTGSIDFTPGSAVGPFGSLAGDTPVVGDWDGGGRDKIGIYRAAGADGLWFLDNGDRRFDFCGEFPAGDLCLGPFGGVAGDIPMPGDWNSDGKTELGIYRVENSQGFWYLDDGTGNFSNARKLGPFGSPGDRPLSGHWFR